MGEQRAPPHRSVDHEQIRAAGQALEGRLEAGDVRGVDERRAIRLQAPGVGPEATLARVRHLDGGDHQRPDPPRAAGPDRDRVEPLEPPVALAQRRDRLGRGEEGQQGAITRPPLATQRGQPSGRVSMGVGEQDRVELLGPRLRDVSRGVDQDGGAGLDVDRALAALRAAAAGGPSGRSRAQEGDAHSASSDVSRAEPRPAYPSGSTRIPSGFPPRATTGAVIKPQIFPSSASTAACTRAASIAPEASCIEVAEASTTGGAIMAPATVLIATPPRRSCATPTSAT
jgi:hypothetical protein